MHLRWLLLCIAMLSLSAMQGQVGITRVETSPTLITTCDSAIAIVKGNLPASNYFLDSSLVAQNANTYTLTLYYSSSGFGLPTITPFTHEENLGVLSQGTYTLNVQYFINGNLSDQQDTTFGVQAGSAPQVSLGPDTSRCDSVPITLVATAGADSYVWNTGDTTALIVVHSSGTYWVAVSQGVCTGRDTIAVNYYTPPTVDLGPDTTLPAGGTLVLDAGNHAAYSWNTGDTTRQLTVDVSGTYAVTITAANGCTASDTIEVSVLTGLSNREAPSDWTLYPNPAQDWIKIQGLHHDAIITVTNIHGQQIHRTTTSRGQNVKLDCRNWPGGLYIITLQSEGQRYSRTFVKE